MAMKKDWVTQERVDEAADALVAEHQLKLIEVTGYLVGKRLECHPNGSLYKKVRDWQQRRIHGGGNKGKFTDADFNDELMAVLHKNTEAQAKLVKELVARNAEEANLSILRSSQEQQEEAAAFDVAQNELLNLIDQLESQVENARRAQEKSDQSLWQAQLLNQRHEGTIEALEKLLGRQAMFAGTSTEATLLEEDDHGCGDAEHNSAGLMFSKIDCPTAAAQNAEGDLEESSIAADAANDSIETEFNDFGEPLPGLDLGNVNITHENDVGVEHPLSMEPLLKA